MFFCKTVYPVSKPKVDTIQLDNSWSLQGRLLSEFLFVPIWGKTPPGHHKSERVVPAIAIERTLQQHVGAWHLSHDLWYWWSWRLLICQEKRSIRWIKISPYQVWKKISLRKHLSYIQGGKMSLDQIIFFGFVTWTSINQKYTVFHQNICNMWWEEEHRCINSACVLIRRIDPSIHPFIIHATRREAGANPKWFWARSRVYTRQVTNL